jgi:hypothetical protein
VLSSNVSLDRCDIGVVSTVVRESGAERVDHLHCGELAIDLSFIIRSTKYKFGIGVFRFIGPEVDAHGGLVDGRRVLQLGKQERPSTLVTARSIASAGQGKA